MAGCQAAWIRLWQTTQQVWARLALGFLSVGLMARNNYQITLSSSTSLPVARTDATAEVLIAVANSQAEGNLVRRLEISLPPKGGSPCHSYASDASLRDVQFEHSGRATYGDLVRGKRGRCPSGSPATSAARAWRDRAFKRGRPVTLLHQTGQGKTQLHRYMPAARLPPADRPQWGLSLIHI